MKRNESEYMVTILKLMRLRCEHRVTYDRRDGTKVPLQRHKMCESFSRVLHDNANTMMLKLNTRMQKVLLHVLQSKLFARLPSSMRVARFHKSTERLRTSSFKSSLP